MKRITELAAEHTAETLKAARSGRRRRDAGQHWRHHVSVAIACLPEEVADRNAELKKKNIRGACFLPDGSLKLDSRNAQKAYCREHGLINRDDYA
jgi:hypothetical protein